MTESTLIIAHRGLSSLYPENTLIAFRKALELGVDFIELDIRLSRDRELMVIHDETLERTTDGKGRVGRLTLSQIKKYSAGKWFSDSFKKERVPTLKEVFELIDGKVKLFIEIKQSGIERRLINLIQCYDMTDNIICISYLLESITKIRKLNSSIPVGLLTDRFEPEKSKDFLRANINMILITFSHLTPDVLKTCHSYGFTLGVGIPEKEEDLKKTLEMGVSIIITDYPQRLKKLLKECK